MYLFSRFLILGIPIVTHAQSVSVPSDSCVWRGERYGHMQVCEGNEVPVGACGSGKNDDCDSGDWHQLLCCDLPDYYFVDCLDFKGEYGDNLSCPELMHDDSTLIEGICGSGMYHDCDGSTHIVHCCHGVFVDGDKLSSDTNCYWKYGVYGEKVTCNFADEAVFGRCGSGYRDDCGTEKWHGIQCCRLIKVASGN